jgi:hypothetical protein
MTTVRSARTVLLFVVMLLIASGCVRVSPQGRELVRADVGPYPSDYQAMVSMWLKTNLKDPYSVMDLQMTSPVEDRYWGGLLITGGYISAYRSCVRYNAKNSFGAYVGLRTYSFWMKDNRVIATTDGC